MPSDVKALVRRWFEEVWNQGRDATIDELCAPDSIGVGLGAGEAPVHGPDGFRVFHRNITSALSDLHITLEDIIAEGDTAVVRITLDAKHTGPGLGVPPTGNNVHFAGIVITKWSDGKVVRAWNSLLQQVRAIPAEKDRFLETEK